MVEKDRKGKNFFSIIIPLYNKEKFILNTIASIVNQNYTNYEIIVIDDCSTDESNNKILELKETKSLNQLNFIKNFENKGVSFSRNRGIEISKGDFLIFLDADDEFNSNDILNKLNSFINTYNAEYIMITRNYYDKFVKPNFKYKNRGLTLLENSFYKINDNIRVALDGNFPFGGSASAVVSAKLIGTYKFDINESRFEDWSFFFKIYMDSNAYFCDSVFIKINYAENSLSKNFNTKVIKIPSFYKILDSRKDFYKLRKKFFWIWMTGIVINISTRHNIIAILKKYNNEILHNLAFNKYSIYCFFKILVSIIFFRKKKKEK